MWMRLSLLSWRRASFTRSTAACSSSSLEFHPGHWLMRLPSIRTGEALSAFHEGKGHGGDRSSISQRAQVLGRIETESRRMPP